MIQRNRHPRDKVGYPGDYSMSWNELAVLGELERAGCSGCNCCNCCPGCDLSDLERSEAIWTTREIETRLALALACVRLKWTSGRH